MHCQAGAQIQHLLWKLIRGAEDYQAGKLVQVTRFLAFAQLCVRDEGPAFCAALLRRVYAETVESGISPIVSLEEKCAIFEQSIEIFSGDLKFSDGCWTVALYPKAGDLAERLYQLQPGWKRIWVHAKRRRATDKDLLLLENLLDGCFSLVVELFLTSYEGYRYHLLPDAGQRVLWMAGFWSDVLFGESIAAFIERMRDVPPWQPPRKKPTRWAKRMARSQAVISQRRQSEAWVGDSVATLPSPKIKPYSPYALDDAVAGRLNALEMALEKNDHDDPVMINLGRAHYNLVQAWRGFRDNHELKGVATRLKGAKNRCCEVWLYRNGHISDIDGDRPAMKSLFCSLAPLPLLRKEVVLEEKLTCLLYEDTYTDQAFAGIEMPTNERRPEMAACLAETLAFYDHFLDGAPLPQFRWEREGDYRLGQYVWRLERVRHVDVITGDLLSFWRVVPSQAVHVAERSVVVRRLDKRFMERLDPASIFLLPTSLHVDLQGEYNQRTLWFDLRPQLRQVPFYIPRLIGVGQSFNHAIDFEAALYQTCLCCGYPVRLSENAARVLDREKRDFKSWCPICGWHGKDFITASRSKANFGYSLRTARENFRLYGSIFRAEDGEDYLRHQLAAVKDLKCSLCAAFEAMIGESNHGRLFLLWWQAEGLKQALQRMHFQLEGFEVDKPSAPEPGLWVNNLVDTESLVVAMYYGYNSVILRIRNRHGQSRDIGLEYGRELIPRQCVDIWSPFFARRTWFECFSEFLCGHVPCPCCGYPTLKSRASLEHCSICHWYDTGQDDQNADQAADALNGDITLTQARQNFAETSFGLGIRRLQFLYDLLITVENADTAEKVWKKIEIIQKTDQGE